VQQTAPPIPIVERSIPATIALEVRDLYKSYGETRALQGVSVTFAPGTVHTILGENGSGKSTMVKILSGIIGPDKGELRVNGTPVNNYSPNTMRRFGIAPVLQEVLVAPNRSVLENIFLGYDGLFKRRISYRDRADRAVRALGHISKLPFDLDQAVGTLPLSSQQLVVIARALVRDPQILILDESTAALDVNERDTFFEAIRSFVADGKLVIFISHRIDEVLELSDFVTVLRNGKTVDTVPRADLHVDRLLHLLMPDVKVEEAHKEATRATTSGASTARPILHAQGIRTRPDAAPIDAIVREGEIVGLAGLEGHGQEEFLETLCGLRKPLAGNVVAKNEHRDLPIIDLQGAVNAGIIYLPRSRKSQGILPSLSVLDNFTIAAIGRGVAGRFGVINWRAHRQRMDQYRDLLSMVYQSPGALITSLSGGNQQKVLLARWMALQPRLMLLNDPTRGVDLPTRLKLYDVLRQTVAETNVGLVVLSTEIEELLLLCTRVLVFREGHVFTELDRSQLTRAAVIAGMFGKHHQETPTSV